MVAPTAPEIAARRIDLVVIGGSAGAVEVLQGLMSSLTRAFAPAMAIVLHLPPDARGVLHEVLASPLSPPMKPAEDKEPVLAGTVYFASPGYHLLVESGGTFALSIDEPVHFSRPSIDVLFESAAEAYGERALGIVLSGANCDGAEGLQAIAAAGGVTVVQDPSSAAARAMPEAALRTCRGCHVADVAGIAALLAGL